VTVEWLKTVTNRGFRNHSGDRFLAGRDYSPLGRLLLPAVFLVMAISLLLFSCQLFNGWIWRRGPPVVMAAVGPPREHDGRAHVRDLGKPAVCAYQSAPRRQDEGSVSQHAIRNYVDPIILGSTALRETEHA
jgi:hypothetical protein